MVQLTRQRQALSFNEPEKQTGKTANYTRFALAAARKKLSENA